MSIKFLHNCTIEVKDDPSDDSYTEDISAGEIYQVELLDDKADCIDAKFPDGSVAVSLPKELFIQINN